VFYTINKKQHDGVVNVSNPVLYLAQNQIWFSMPHTGDGTARATTFAAWPTGANKKLPSPSMLNHNLFSGLDQPVAHNMS